MSGDTNAEFDLAKSQRTRQMNARKKSKRRPVREPNSTGNFSLANVFRDTVNVCDEMFSAARGNMPPLSLKLTHDRLQDWPDQAEPLTQHKSFVEVRDVDVVELMREFCADTSLKNPLMLNLASDMYPGGGVNSGKKAQEECIFRRTNAYMTHPLEWYPLQPTELIYSPVVHAIKGLDHKLLPPSQFCSFGMVTVAALRKPRLDSEGCYRFQDDRELMAAKVDAIFRVALMHGHDSLVLGALGCGVFRNPPKEVAAMFQQCIEKYGHFFKRIGFAILVVKPVDRENYNVFNALNSPLNETAENV